MSDTEKKNTYISLHKNFVRENIEYTDRETGEAKTFNQARLPQGTVIDGQDLSGYEFSPLFVNEPRFKGENWRDIPLLTNKEVWLRKSVMDQEGSYLTDESGKQLKDTVCVMPTQIKDALNESRRAWAEEHKNDRTLADRATEVKSVSEALEHNTQARTPQVR